LIASTDVPAREEQEHCRWTLFGLLLFMGAAVSISAVVVRDVGRHETLPLLGKQ
jgi:hypothetical protein